MDSFTHTLTGAMIARAMEDEEVGSWGTIAGLAMGLFPDIDFVLGLFNRRFYYQYHRDFTHSLLLIPLYALFFSWLFKKISGRGTLWSFYKICLVVLVSHVLLDLLTSYGTMIFSPFIGQRYAWDLIFIIDLIFSGIVFFPLLISLLWKRRSRWICRSSVFGLTLYILFCWVQHHRAIELTETFSKNLGEEVIQVASLPQPLSPFRWANYVETKDKVYQGFVDLKKKDLPNLGTTSSRNQVSERQPYRLVPTFFEKMDSLYWPPGRIQYRSWQKIQSSLWVEKALATDGVKFYYWFARFPVVKSINSKDGRHRVEFMDVRFLLPGIRLPFVYHVEFDDSGRVQSEGFARDRKE